MQLKIATEVYTWRSYAARIYIPFVFPNHFALQVRRILDLQFIDLVIEYYRIGHKIHVSFTLKVKLMLHCFHFLFFFFFIINEPRHDKTKKMAVRPAKTQISLGIHPLWSVFAVRMKKPWILSYPFSIQRKIWSVWADAKADLSLRRAHTYFVMSRLIYFSSFPALPNGRWDDTKTNLTHYRKNDYNFFCFNQIIDCGLSVCVWGGGGHRIRGA